MTEMNIKGIIFDFDGLILDTETPEMQAWEKAFSSNGLIFPAEKYLKGIGTVSDNLYVQDIIHEMVQSEAQVRKINQDYKIHIAELEAMNKPREGILELIHDAEKVGLLLGVASSSYRVWVEGNLQRLGLDSHFDPICTRDNVTYSKPDPELYNLVLSTWGVIPEEVFVLEDSPNGIRAAKNAGIFCIAVPNPITSQMDVSQADLVFSSFLDFSLQEILTKLKE